MRGGNDWVWTPTSRDSVILRAVVGSTVHGVSVGGQDDRDEMGVCIEPPEYVIGLHHFEHYVQRDKPDGVRSEPGDLDLVIYSLRKFCRLALKGNPSILLLLYVPKKFTLVETEEGRALRELAPAFASLRAGRAFLGYMSEQLARLKGERGQKSVKRPELIEKYGYDTKCAYHILRLGHQGLDYLKNGKIRLPMPPLMRDHLLRVRRGEIPLTEVLKEAEWLKSELQICLDGRSKLPPEPDEEKVNDFLVETYRNHWGWVEPEFSCNCDC